MRETRLTVWGRIAAVLISALLHYLLSKYLSFDVGQIRISVDQLPILLLAILFGPIEAAVAALLGGFFYQVELYGLQWMLVPWLISNALRGVIVGYGCRYLAVRNDDKPWKKPVQFVALLCFAAIVTTIVNTALIWIEVRNIFTQELVFDSFYTRLFLSTVIAVIIGLVLPPVSHAIDKRMLSGRTSESDRHEKSG